MNFYKHHLGDYDGATAHLSWDEDMAYTRLLRAYYRTERPIPCDQAYRLARANSRAQRAAVDSVLGEFFKQDGDCWRNKRADEEIVAYQAQAETNRRIAQGRKGQRSVNESSHETSNEASANRTPNHKPDTRTKNQEPEPEKNKSKGLTPSADAPDWLPPEFLEFEQHRREKHTKLTPTARSGCIAKLGRWREQGHDIVAVLRRSIDNGYTGLIDPNEQQKGNGSGRSSLTAHNLAAGQEFLRREREKDEKPAS